MTASGDTVQRVFAQIASLKQNLLDVVDERQVDIFHAQLDRLEHLGYDMNEFRVPEEYLFQRMSGPRHIRRDLFAQKLDAVLLYFAPRPEPQPPIGFTKPT